MNIMQSTDKQMEYITIIMPAYNSEDYIRRGIESCILQTYHNWMLFVVDDGSVDSTAAVIQSYCRIDSRIQYLYQKNSGVSAARNHGLEHAKGEYVVFLDADDWLQRDALDTLLHLQKKNRDLLIACNRKLVKEVDALQEWNKSISVKKEFEDKLQISITKLTRLEALRNTGTQRYNNSSVNKIFDRRVIEEQRLRFDPSIFYGEDGLFVFQYLLAVNGMLHYDACLWSLLERSGSATRRNFTARNLTAVWAIESMRTLLRAENSDMEGRNITAQEITEVDNALQVYGGSITYNLVRRYIEAQMHDSDIEMEFKKALNRYKRVYCKVNKGRSAVKYIAMCLCPFEGYQVIYQFTHRK